ncbi:hypothetical protein [Aquimarina megaterium]|uniref:hypothetical protein n=1 Tax=Aquimarina megaterium TaxID=1443666 RepID=UPI00111287EF|nr:hypothetical protein [Aquimarina megaterium]
MKNYNLYRVGYLWLAFLASKKNSLCTTYHNAKSIKYKVEFVKKNELAGIIFWKFNGGSGTLLNAIFNNLYAEK